MFNGNSACSNGNSFGMTAADDPRVRSLPWLFRVGIPGFEAGWPAR
jgi:hypothetical protein